MTNSSVGRITLMYDDESVERVYTLSGEPEDVCRVRIEGARGVTVEVTIDEEGAVGVSNPEGVTTWMVTK